MSSLILSVIKVSLTTAAVTALMLLFMRFFGKRFTSKCRYIIWCAVILRLCVPFDANLPSLLSVSIPAKIELDDTHVAVDINAPLVLPTVTVPSETPVDLLVSPAAKKNDTESALRAAAVIWFAGAVVFMALKLAIYNRQIRRQISAASPASDQIQAQYITLCEQMLIKNPPTLCVSPVVASPMLCGFLRRRVVLPDFALSGDALNGVLSHELTHHIRGDLWMKLACVTARAIHWFNPLGHIAAAQCNTEMELACDDVVLAGLDDTARLSYGETMLCIVKHRVHQTVSLTTQFNPTARAARQRMANILDSGRKKRGILVIALILALCAASGIIIGCNIEQNIEKGEVITGKFGFSIPLPDEYTSNIETEPDEGLSDNEIVRFYHVPTHSHPEWGGENSGLLFSILRFTADRLVPEEFMPANESFFAEGDGWYYVISKPTDVQYVPTDETLKSGYFMLQDKSDEIAKDFIKANNLQPFTTDDIDRAKGYARHSLNMDLSGLFVKPAADAITLGVSLPEGWIVSGYYNKSVNPFGMGYDYDVEHDPCIKENGQSIAEISISGFEIYPDVPENRFYHMVYSNFMNSNMADWDSGYKPVWNRGATVSASDKVDVNIAAQGGARRETYSFRAVLSYDTELLVYVVISFDRDYHVTDETLEYIARSIKLSAFSGAVANETDAHAKELFVTPVVANQRADKTDDAQLLAMFENSLYPNSIVICDIYMSGAGLNIDYEKKYAVTDTRADYALVNNIENIEVFKDSLRAVFSENRLNKSVYPMFFEGEIPLFVENDEKLYYNANTGGARAYSPNYSEAAVLSKSAEHFTVEIPMTTLDDEQGTPFIYNVVKQNGVWVFDTNYWFDYEYEPNDSVPAS